MTLTVHIVLCEILVNQLKLDLVGICLSTNLNPILNMILVTWWIEKYEKNKDLKEAWSLVPDRKSFVGMKRYAKMGVAACAMICLEFWTFDMQQFIGSFISP